MKSNKTLYITILVLILLGIGIFFSLKSSNNQGNIKIGALFPLTGGLASYGEPAQRSVQLAVDEINNTGGVNGQKIEVNFLDHKCDPKTAVTIFQQISATSKTNLFLAVGCSGTVLSVAQQLQNQILLGSAITSPKISGVSPFVFRNYVSDDKESALFAKVIKEKGYKTVGVIFEKTDYAEGLKINLEKYLEESGVSVVGEGFVTGSTDVKTQVTKIKSANPDVVFVSPQTVTSGDLVLGEMQRQAYHPKIIVNENIFKSSDLLSRYSELLNGGLSADYVLVDNEKINNLMNKYKEKYGTDCPQKNICATMFDNVYLYANAIKEKGNDIKAIQAYLKTETYSGSSGQISFDEKNDRKDISYTLFEIKEGKGVEVK
jgi:branched-chain amino acid transport system substrate-binding protein